MDEKDLLICIPFRNNEHLLQEALGGVGVYRKNVILFDNSFSKALTNKKDVLGVKDIISPVVPLTFSQTLNYFNIHVENNKLPFWFFMHVDCGTTEGTVTKLFNESVRKVKESILDWGVIFTNYDVLCSFNTLAWKRTGGMDTTFNWYYSDTEFYNRLNYFGYGLKQLGEFDVVHKNGCSNTIKMNSDLNYYKVNIYDPFCRTYYKRKWGSSMDYTKPDEGHAFKFTVQFNHELNREFIKHNFKIKNPTQDMLNVSEVFRYLNNFSLGGGIDLIGCKEEINSIGMNFNFTRRHVNQYGGNSSMVWCDNHDYLQKSIDCLLDIPNSVLISSYPCTGAINKYDFKERKLPFCGGFIWER